MNYTLACINFLACGLTNIWLGVGEMPAKQAMLLAGLSCVQFALGCYLLSEGGRK